MYIFVCTCVVLRASYSSIPIIVIYIYVSVGAVTVAIAWYRKYFWVCYSVLDKTFTLFEINFLQLFHMRKANSDYHIFIISYIQIYIYLIACV